MLLLVHHSNNILLEQWSQPSYQQGTVNSEGVPTNHNERSEFHHGLGARSHGGRRGGGNFGRANREQLMALENRLLESMIAKK